MRDDSTNQPYSRTASPPRIEWRAIIAGICVGFALSVVWRWALLFVSSNVISGFVGAGRTHWVFIGLRLGFTFVNGTVVGFIVARFAPSRPYHHAFLTTLFAWLLGFLLSLAPERLLHIGMRFSFFLSWSGLTLMFALTCLSFAGAFYGAYMAQSFKRTRGVQID